MDRHVRWFRREVAVGVGQRLAAESVIAAIASLGLLLASGAGILLAIMVGIVAFPTFALVRVGLACISNPMTSAYLMRWPHPTGHVQPTEQTNIGSNVDSDLRALRFVPRGAFNEWGGATTNLYTRSSSQLIVATTEDDDVLVLSALADERLVVTCTQLVPPHEQLVVNRVDASDLRTVLGEHVDVIRHLHETSQPAVTAIGMDDVMRFLAIEWDSWDQIGPLLGPFVAIGQKRQPSLLQVRVPNDEILARTGTPEPRVTARRHDATPAISPIDAVAELDGPLDALSEPTPIQAPTPLHPQPPPTQPPPRQHPPTSIDGQPTTSQTTNVSPLRGPSTQIFPVIPLEETA